jgi:hypothetical protein
MTNEKAGPREESKELFPCPRACFFIPVAYFQMRANWRI